MTLLYLNSCEEGNVKYRTGADALNIATSWYTSTSVDLSSWPTYDQTVSVMEKYNYKHIEIDCTG